MAEQEDQQPHGLAGSQAAGPRGLWSGTISFGLVSVPVEFYPSVRAGRVPLRQLGPDGQPLQRRYFCSADGTALANDDLARGYERADGRFVVVSDEELAGLAPGKSRDIDLRCFVRRDTIPAELLERPYVLAPAGDSTKAYHLLAQAMERSGRAGIATFVMRGKEYLAAIFAESGLLRAVTMHFVEEIRTPRDVGLPAPVQVGAAARKAAEAALEKLHRDDIDPVAFEDEHSAALRDLAARKRASGEDVVIVAEAVGGGGEGADGDQGTADVIDIMSVLKQRIGAARVPAEHAAAGRDSRAAQTSRASAKATRSAKAVPRTRPEPAKQKASAKPRAAPKAVGVDPTFELERTSKKALYAQAAALGVPNRSHMSKQELVAAILRAAG